MGGFALESTPFGLDPEYAQPDNKQQAVTNRKEQREQAAVQAAGATNLLKEAEKLEAGLNGSISDLVKALQAPRTRTLSR